MDMTIMHGRFWPVGSVQVGNAASAFTVVVVRPLVIINAASITKKRVRPTENRLPVIVFLLLYI